MTKYAALDLFYSALISGDDARRKRALRALWEADKPVVADTIRLGVPSAPAKAQR